MLGLMIKAGIINIRRGIFIPTPIDSDFSGAGNTIDSDSTSYHLGLSKCLGNSH